MIGWIKLRAQQRLVRHVRSRYGVTMSTCVQGVFNYQCHQNCVQYVLDRPTEDLEVVECIYMDDGCPILHYLVHNKATAEYMEVTLGHFGKLHEFHIIRTIHPNDYMRITEEFRRSLDDWRDSFVPALFRPFIDRIT